MVIRKIEAGLYCLAGDRIVLGPLSMGIQRPLVSALEVAPVPILIDLFYYLLLSEKQHGSPLDLYADVLQRPVKTDSIGRKSEMRTMYIFFYI